MNMGKQQQTDCYGHVVVAGMAHAPCAFFNLFKACQAFLSLLSLYFNLLSLLDTDLSTPHSFTISTTAFHHTQLPIHTPT